MTKVLRIGTFNVNQFSTPAHQRADLVDRMADVDVVLVQECVHLDLVAFAATMPGWAAFQHRAGDNDGHANTGVLYRTALGKVTDTALVDLGRADGAKPDEHSRERFLAGVEFNGADWFASFHGFPSRDAAANPTLLKRVGAWIAEQVAAGKSVTAGCDKNQITVSELEKATGLTWHGVKIDGFLTRLRISKPAEFPKGFSDHPGVHANVTLPDHQEKHVSRLQHILQLLRQALRRARANGHEKRAAKEKAAIKALGPKAHPHKPTPPGHAKVIPSAIQKPIPQTESDPDIIPVGAVFHVAVSEASSLHDFFEHDGGIESTGYIRRDGTIEQYRPLTVECDAQFTGNSWIGGDGKRYGLTSWETQGMGTGEWTPQQIVAIQKIITFLHVQWSVPLRVNPGPNAAGFGYHCLFDAWNLDHHTCPGPDRVAQFKRVIVPFLAKR